MTILAGRMVGSRIAKLSTNDIKPLRPVGSMPMWYYPRARLFRYPIPTEFEFAYINREGEVVISGPFLYARCFQNGLAEVILPGDQPSGALEPELSFCPRFGRLTYLRPDGNEVSADRRDWSALDHGLFEGLAAWRTDGGYRYRDESGEFVGSAKFRSASRFREGLAVVSESRKLSTDPESLEFYYDDDYFYIDRNFNRVIPGPYLAANPFSEKLASVMVGGKWGFIDHACEFQIPRRYDWAGSFVDGLAPVEKLGLVGFINKRGRTIVPSKFKDARDFGDGLAPATLDARYWGFIDKKGKFAIEPKFLGAFPFSEGLALVYLPSSPKR